MLYKRGNSFCNMTKQKGSIITGNCLVFLFKFMNMFVFINFVHILKNEAFAKCNPTFIYSVVKINLSYVINNECTLLATLSQTL